MKVKIQTTFGDCIVRLYDETPIHRDNFVRLVKEGYYDGTLLHRVIRDFMIQGGDPDSKGAPYGKQLGSGGPGYCIDAELDNRLFHKRGALAMARLGDEVNPERRSSGSQFYIVWGTVYKEGQIRSISRNMELQQLQDAYNALLKEHRGQMLELRKQRDRAGVAQLQEQLAAMAEEQVSQSGRGISEAHQKVYTTLGGAPHLDGQYTVFGEVEEGLDIVEKIQQVATDGFDRPKDDIVVTMTLLEED